MVGDDDYELVKKHELDELREEIARLKKDPLKDYESSVTLIEAMDRLAGQVDKLVRIFEQANKELHEEYSEGFHEEADKLDKLVRQNEKIAKGVLAVADLVQDEKSAGGPEGGRYPLQNQQSPEPAPSSQAQPPATPKPQPQPHQSAQQQSQQPVQQPAQQPAGEQADDLPPPPSFDEDERSGKRRDIMDNFFP